ncbi:MAG TPA: hypothetical protein VF173_05545 [Thermoanaerobaculia bacterium]|nr:hypothetical protein [Thermoanaerobaculia bacterium]
MTDWTPVDLLPVLWLVLAGAVLAAALRRWYEPVPGRVLAVFAAVLLALFGPVLFGGRVLLPPPHGNPAQEDMIRVVAPAQAAARAALEEGHWPLWNRRAGAGMPLLADLQSQALQPLTLLGWPLPLARAAGFVAALRVLAGLAFSFLWLRRLGMRAGLALAGSLAYGVGLLPFWAGWTAGNVGAFLPVGLYGLARRDGTGRGTLLVAVALVGILLGGDLAASAGGLGILAIYALTLGLRGLAGLGAALGVVAAVSAPVLLPAWRYLPQAVAPWAGISSQSWRWRLPATPLGVTIPKSDSIGAVRYGLATHGLKGFRMAALGDVLPPNLAGLYGLEDARISGPMAPRDYLELVKPLDANGPGDPLYRRLGVRYLLTPLAAELPSPWVKIFADSTAAVWEQADPFPLLFLATPRPAGGVLIQRLEDTWISGPANLRRRQWLGTSIYQDGGWLLLIDGYLHHTGHGTFVATRLPAGAMRLDLLYRPAPFVWGCVITALGLVAGFVLFIPKPAR